MTEDTQGRDQFTPGLIGFYVSCTVFGIAAAVACVCWIVFSHIPGVTVVAWVGTVLAIVSAVFTWHYLAVSRRER